MAITNIPLSPDERLTIRQVAAEFDRNPEYIRRLIRAGVLPGEPVGFRWMLRRGDVEAYFSRTNRTPQAAGTVAARHRRRAAGL